MGGGWAPQRRGGRRGAGVRDGARGSKGKMKGGGADIGTGPGKVSKLLGIHYSASGMDICQKPKARTEAGIWIEDRGVLIQKSKILSTPRIGVDYAGEDSLLPYRFLIAK